MAWFYLLIAGLFEVAWAIGLKYTDGFTRLVPSIWTVGSMAVSFLFLSLALKTLPVGTAYAVGPESARSGVPSSASSCSRSPRTSSGSAASP
jgi:multidrug transporter EmrE-like cation transporter